MRSQNLSTMSLRQIGNTLSDTEIGNILSDTEASNTLTKRKHFVR